MGAAESSTSSRPPGTMLLAKEQPEKSKRTNRGPKRKCVLLFDDDDENDALHSSTLLLNRKDVLRLVWNLPKRLRLTWRKLFDTNTDGLSFTRLIESLTKNEATSFCIAVETKEKKGEIFGALMVFPEREGLTLNKTEWQGLSESYLFTFPQKQANVKRQPKKFLASANTDGHYCWCCRDMVASERFPNGLAFGGKEYPIKHFAMHIDEHMETLTTRKTGVTYEGWGCEDSNIENETMTIERVEVWQCDAEDERGEKPKKKNNIVAEMDGSAAVAAQKMKMKGGESHKNGDGGVLSEKHREARFLATVGSTKIALE
jgi:hypothetical protein